MINMMIPVDMEHTFAILAWLALLFFSYGLYYLQGKESRKNAPPTTPPPTTPETKLTDDEEIVELMKDYIINTHALRQLAPGGAEYNIRSKHVSELCLELRSVFSLYGMPRSYSSLAPLRSLARVDNDIVSTFNVWYEYKQALLSKTSKESIHNKVLDKSIGDLHHSLYCLFNERVRTQETEELQRHSVFENTVHSGSQGNTGGFVVCSGSVMHFHFQHCFVSHRLARRHYWNESSSIPSCNETGWR